MQVQVTYMLTYNVCACSCAVAVLHVSIFAYSSSVQTSSSAPKELNFGNLEKNLESPTDSVIKDDLPECLFSDGSGDFHVVENPTNPTLVNERPIVIDSESSNVRT